MQNLIQVNETKFSASFLAKKAAFEARIKAEEEAKNKPFVSKFVASEEFLAKKKANEEKWANGNGKGKKQHVCPDCGERIFLRANQVAAGVYRGWHKVNADGSYHVCGDEYDGHPYGWYDREFAL
jgi:hypothetical protein